MSIERQLSSLRINSEADVEITDKETNCDDEQRRSPDTIILTTNIDIPNNKGEIAINIINDDEGNVEVLPADHDPNYSTPEHNKSVLGRENCKTSRTLNFDRGNGEPQQLRLSTDVDKVVGKPVIRKRKRNGKLQYRDRKRRRNVIKKEYNFNIEKNSGTVMVVNNENGGQSEDREDVETDGCSTSETLHPRVNAVADELYFDRLKEIMEVINQLHPLRDNGQWQVFDRRVVDMKLDYARKHNKRYLEVLLTIETSITLSYQKEFEKSRKACEDAKSQLKTMNDNEMGSFLVAYLHCHETALHRRLGKCLLKEPATCIVIAEQNIDLNVFSIIKAFAAYERASNSTKLMSLINRDDEQERSQIYENCKGELRHCITVCEQVIRENSSIYLVRQHFALIKLALLNLNCRTKASRKLPVTSEEINEAENCIERIEELYEGQVNRNQSLTVLLYTAKCDLSFRKGDLNNAHSLALQGLKIAKHIGLKLEITYLEERVVDISRLLND